MEDEIKVDGRIVGYWDYELEWYIILDNVAFSKQVSESQTNQEEVKSL